MTAKWLKDDAKKRVNTLAKSAWQCVRRFCKEEEIPLGEVTATRLWIQSRFKPAKAIGVDWFLLSDAIEFCAGDLLSDDLEGLRTMAFYTWWLEVVASAPRRQ